MFGFFKKKAKSYRDIDQVIFDIAEYNREEDYEILYKALVGRELYLPVDPSSLPPECEPGQKIITDASHQISIRSAQGPNGEAILPASLSSTHPNLQGSYIGMEWLEILNMALKIPDNWGVLVQGKTSYVGFDKERAKHILNTYGA